jgi:G3E family GTPase
MKPRETPLPMTVLSGFLGSGKTTLVNYLLRHNEGQKILVLVNDFGALPIDEDLIESQDGEILSLANGCACCSMGGDLFEAFDAALKFEPTPDQLLIEASGVAEPRRIANFARAEPDLQLNGIVTIVDAANMEDGLQDPRLLDVMKEQISSAHILLLNKCDLVSQVQKGRVRNKLKDLNDEVTPIDINHGRVPPEIIFGKGKAADMVAIETNPQHNHGDIFDHWALKSPKLFEKQALWETVSSLPNTVLRFKGIFRTPDAVTAWSIHKVGAHVDIARIEEPSLAEPHSEFVAIGLKEDNISEVLDAVFPTDQ